MKFNILALNKNIRMIMFLLILLPLSLSASQIDFQVNGLMYHTPGNVIPNNRLPEKMVNKLDSKAAFVFTPGLGFALDLRDSLKNEGVSWVFIGGYMRDCFNYSYTFLGGGWRYQKLLTKNISIAADLLLSIAYTRLFKTCPYVFGKLPGIKKNERYGIHKKIERSSFTKVGCSYKLRGNYGLMPVPNPCLRINYHFKKVSFGINFAFMRLNLHTSLVCAIPLKELIGCRDAKKYP